MEILYGGIIGIVGIIIGSLLQSSRELKNYRRDRLEQCAISITEHSKSIEKFYNIIIKFLRTGDKTEMENYDLYKEIHRIRGQTQDCNTLVSLHGRSLEELTKDYSKSIQSWIDYFKELPTSGKANNDTIEKFEDLYKKINDVKQELLDAISKNIYKKSWYEKWPWNWGG